MKRLALLRHAKSSWGNGSLVDHDRPLSARGERDASEMGSRLLSRGTEPSLCLSSTATRASTTTKKIVEALNSSHEIIKTDRRLYLASHSDILKLIREQKDTISDLLIVGHNPGLTSLANHLLPDLRLKNLPTTGIVAIESTAQKWSELSQSSLSLLYYDYPKNTKSLSDKN
jgi:phosphohistidine phosphatase